MEWTLVDAKNRFSELVRRAIAEGPQRVLRRGDGAVVVVAERDYEKLTGKRPEFKRMLLEGPDFDELDLARDRAPMRDVSL
jgi:antitoxin Phd